MGSLPRVSFVVPAWNEEQVLPECLASIRAAAGELLEPRDFELIVVDDGSIDRTAEVAAEGGAEVVSVELRQISAVRNAGARVARGSRLVFVDADTRISPALLEAAFEALDGGAVGGGAPVHFDARLPLAMALFVRLLLCVFRVLNYAGGCFCFVDRRAFEAVGGYSEELYGTEEIALARALKREGEFVLLHVPVVSSARKLLNYSALEFLGMSLRQLWRGRGAFRSRAGLDIWYGPRR